MYPIFLELTFKAVNIQLPQFKGLNAPEILYKRQITFASEGGWPKNQSLHKFGGLAFF